MEIDAALAALPEVPRLVGLTGVAFYLRSYFALQTRLIRGTGFLYPSLNLIASGCVLFELSRAFNVTSAAIQVSWFVISLIGIGMHVRALWRSRFTPEEQAFVESKLEGLDRHIARRIVDLARIEDLPVGHYVAREGVPFRDLIYVIEGEISCGPEDRVFYRHGADEYIGEITTLSGAPATICCRVTAPTRCLAFPAAALRRLADRDPMVRIALESSFSKDFRWKYVETDRAYRRLREEAEAA